MARSAARNSLLDPPLGTWTTGMDTKRDDYNRFTTYHFRCTVRLLVFLSTGELVKKTGTDWVWFNTRCGVCPLTSRSIVVPAEVLGTKYTAMWWVEYWERIVGAVGDSPCEKPFDDEPIWNSTLQALARGCPACHETAAKEFPLFRERLVNMVTKIIEDVRIPLCRLVHLMDTNLMFNRSDWRSSCDLRCLSFVAVTLGPLIVSPGFAFTSVSQSIISASLQYQHYLLMFTCLGHRCLH